MHKPDQSGLQLDRSRLPYSEHLGLISQEATQPNIVKKAHYTWDDNEVKDLGGLEQGEHYFPLEIEELHEKMTIGEYRIVSFKNNWASDEGEPKGLD